jgi:hypothetical protein
LLESGPTEPDTTTVPGRGGVMRGDPEEQGR